MGKSKSCLVCPWNNVPGGGSFPQSNYVGDESSERHSGALSKGVLSGGNYFWDNFPGVIIQGEIIRGSGQFSSRQLSGGNCPGGNHPVENFLRGQLSGHRFVEQLCFCLHSTAIFFVNSNAIVSKGRIMRLDHENNPTP